MPTYDYQCEKCGQFEVWQSIKDNALAACPTCGAKVQRLLSANVGFILKGSGFYQNDYKNPTSSLGPKSMGSETSGPASSTGSGQSCGACGSPDPCPNN